MQKPHILGNLIHKATLQKYSFVHVYTHTFFMFV